MKVLPKTKKELAPSRKRGWKYTRILQWLQNYSNLQCAMSLQLNGQTKVFFQSLNKEAKQDFELFERAMLEEYNSHE